MTDKDLGAAAGDIFAKAFTLGYEAGRTYDPGALFPATEPAEEAPNLAAVAQEPRRFDPADECQNDNHDPGCTCGAQHWMTTPAPAEPAEEVKPVKFRKMTAKYATDNFGFPDVTVDPFTPFMRWAYKDSDGDKWAWNGDQWELRIAPAEPAEEETKAEACAGIFQGDRAYLCALAAGHYGDHTTADGEHWQKRPAASPVVPAPTETGPWMRIEDVPEGVLQIKDRHGRTWLMVGGTWRFEWHDGNWHEPHTNINAQAPFVAAKEG